MHVAPFQSAVVLVAPPTCLVKRYGPLLLSQMLSKMLPRLLPLLASLLLMIQVQLHHFSVQLPWLVLRTASSLPPAHAVSPFLFSFLPRLFFEFPLHISPQLSVFLPCTVSSALRCSSSYCFLSFHLLSSCLFDSSIHVLSNSDTLVVILALYVFPDLSIHYYLGCSGNSFCFCTAATKCNNILFLLF